MNKKTILGTPCFEETDTLQVKNYLRDLVKDQKGGYSVAINAEKIMMYKKDNKMKNIIDNSIFPWIDGASVIIAFRLLYKKRVERVNLPKIILELSNEDQLKLFLLGATEKVNSLAAKNIKIKYPRINIVGKHHGYFKDEKVIRDILIKMNPKIVLVALGSPKQEKLSILLNKQLNNTLFVGCGGAFDIFAGKVKRAPKFIAFFEGPYRLIMFKQNWNIKRWLRLLPVFQFILLLLFEYGKKIILTKNN